MRREKTTGDTESDAQLQDPLLYVLQQLRENKPAQQETKQRKVQQKRTIIHYHAPKMPERQVMPSPLTRTRQILRSLLPRTARPKANGIPTLATSHGMSLPKRPFQQLDKGPVRRYLQLPLEKSLE